MKWFPWELLKADYPKVLDESKTIFQLRNEHNRRTGKWLNQSCVLAIVLVYTNGRTVQDYGSLVCQVNPIVIH